MIYKINASTFFIFLLLFYVVLIKLGKCSFYKKTFLIKNWKIVFYNQKSTFSNKKRDLKEKTGDKKPEFQFL